MYYFLGSLLLLLTLNSCESSDMVFEPEVVTPDTQSDVANTDPAPTDFTVLFVGNSLTYYNSLPLLLEETAQRRGLTVKTTEIALANYALIDHWNDGEVQTFIETGNYDFVVVQQGPSSQPYGRMVLLQYGEMFAQLCRANGAQLAFYMVWPSLANYHTFDGVIQNYSDAAAATNSILCPVGTRWREYQGSSGDYSYYGPDGFHPSEAGSQFAAEIILNSLLE